MNIVSDNGNIILKNVKNFYIEQILECGQCFHFNKISEKEYVLVAKGHLLHIKQEGTDVTFYDTKEEEFYNIWWEYFDLNRDYEKIILSILKSEAEYLDLSYLPQEDRNPTENFVESELYKATNEKSGIRILNQDFFEVLISFIISQNKQIPHIKQIVFLLSEHYGEFLGEVCGEKYYSFPTVTELAKVSEIELRECKTGFRAPYIVDACKKVLSGSVEETWLKAASILEAKESLQLIKGVGEKIANCVLLFGLGKRSAFPVDVWIKRIMETIYIYKSASNEEIMELGYRLFGEYGGYAQQYLFFYGRDHQIGGKERNNKNKRK